MRIIALLLFMITSALAGKSILLHRIRGEVDAENFQYYTIKYNGPLKLVLKTLHGDADLYISDHTLTPTYEISQYDLYSASCGKDIVEIPESMKRPLGVGIYGHYSHDKSAFSLEIHLRAMGNDSDSEYDEMGYEDSSEQDDGESSFSTKLRSTIMKTAFITFLEKLEYIFL